MLTPPAVPTARRRTRSMMRSGGVRSRLRGAWTGVGDADGTRRPGGFVSKPTARGRPTTGRAMCGTEDLNRLALVGLIVTRLGGVRRHPRWECEEVARSARAPLPVRRAP